MKRLLVVAHQFPPAGGIGVQRILRFCRDLPSRGWLPLVLTGSGGDYPLQDPALLRHTSPMVKVVRVDLPHSLKRRLPSLAPPAREGRRTLLTRAGYHLWIYDDFYPWIAPALLRGAGMVKRFRPDAIFSTGGPFCSLIAGETLSRWAGIPLYADFRDGWHDCPYRRERGRMPRILEGVLEQRVLSRCRKVFFATRGLLEQYRSRYPDHAGKMEWLPNGYVSSESLVMNPVPPGEGNVLRIKYVGKFTHYRRPDNFLRGLAKAVHEFGCSNIEVEFVGGLQESALRLIGSERLWKSIQVTPFVPHQEAMGRLQAADVLLLIVDRTPGYRVIQTGKIFEYMAARRPLLCISPPDSEAARTVLEEDLGVVVPPEDKAGIARALRGWAQEKKEKGSLTPGRRDLPADYDQSMIANRLVSHLNSALDPNQHSSGGKIGP